MILPLIISMVPFHIVYLWFLWSLLLENFRMINKIYVYKSHTKKSIGRTPAINPFSTNTERKNRDKSVSHLITTTDLIQWSQRLIRAVIEHFLIYFNGKYADFAGIDDVTIPYISHSLFTRHQILWSGDRTYHTKIFFLSYCIFHKS